MVFSVKSFADNETKRYTIEFGDKKNTPKCTCQDWKLSYCPCKHFFAMLQKYHSWLCDALSSLYINSPIFALNSLGENENIENKNMIDVPIDEETADMLNIDNNEVMVIPELPSRKRARTNLPCEWRQLRQRIKNVTFGVEEVQTFL